MSDIVESAKSSMSAAVSRISWEAQKQMRVRGKQAEIDKLMTQRRQLVDDLAQVAMTLYQQGNLSDQQLSRLCASIMELDQDVRKRDAQLQDLKNEAYPVNQFAPSPTMNYNPPPPPPPPSGAPPTPSMNRGATGAQEQICPNCGNPVRANALYCRGCGTKLR
jgi:predicted HTH domain antitoxin